ncbi:MAG: hypothetical protein ACTHLW_21470 [Verrucomicrobiota bacterium]
MSKSAGPTLTDVLKAVGIDKVVWIDDDFSSGDLERQKVRIQELIGRLAAQNITLKHEALTELTFDLPEGVRETKLQEILNVHVHNFVNIIESLTQQLPAEAQEGLETSSELTTVQINALKSALEDVQTMSFKTWTSKKAELLSKCTERTLFLVDRQFSKEGYGDEGDGILKELKAQGKYHCILLTRTKPEEGAELLRKRIAEESQGTLRLSDFAVMSKSDIGETEEGAKREFSHACRVVFTHRHCHKVAERIGEIMKGAISSTVDSLVGHSVYDLDRAIYENSLKEGASELDVLARILLLQQRMATQKGYFEDEQVMRDLVRLRALRSMTELAREHEKMPFQGKLQQWKKEEVFDPAEIVNRLHSPLSCGDVFEMTGTSKKFVMLAQPCDLMTRGDNGMRRAKEGIFVALQETKPRIDEKARYYEIQNMAEAGGSWFIDFQMSASVSLNILELAVFNQNGLVQIAKDQVAADFILPGWKLRFDKALKKVASVGPKEIPKSLASLSLSENLQNCFGKWENDSKTWAFKYQRIGRLRSPYAEAILGSFAAYHTRAAFDHDFARGLWPEESDDQQPKPM